MLGALQEQHSLMMDGCSALPVDTVSRLRAAFLMCRSRRGRIVDVDRMWIGRVAL